MAIIIQNKTIASVARKSTENRNQLPHKGDIYIGTGNKIEEGSTIPDTKGQNIIDAINENATGKDISAGSFTAASFKGNADSATIAAYASADTSKGTIEERLTNLGFKQLPMDSSALMNVSGANLSGSVRILRKGTTREGNRTQILFSAAFAGTAEVGAMFDFFGLGKQAISSTPVIPVEYRPVATSTCTFDYRLKYVYANGLSVIAHACMNCTIFGADTENAGKIALQITPPGISGLSTTLSRVVILSSISYADTGYSSKAL